MEAKQAEALSEEKLLPPTVNQVEAPPMYQPQPQPMYQPQPQPMYQPQPQPMYPPQPQPTHYPAPTYPNQGYTTATHVVVSQPLTVGQAMGEEPYQHVPDYLCLSIFNTLCCCLCLGIAAIVTSSQANSLRNSNNRLAAEKARTARNLNIAGLVCGIIFIAIYIILKFVVSVS